MSEERIRQVLTDRLDSPVEVGEYRGVEGVWAQVEIDPRANYEERPTSLACRGTSVRELKVRFVAATAEEATVLSALRDIEAVTPADGGVSAENHALSEGEELWPHILYEDLPLSEAASVLRAIEREPLPRF
ncbi:hypothetical protein BRD09_03235 [Halobacteriales archaeon SW_10_68_16]|jgi:hypothetical protein|nr:MAG: hypothetical protein BRD09_03235 [Halobacteriales archaeon SW_10_68_16]